MHDLSCWKCNLEVFSLLANGFQERNYLYIIKLSSRSCTTHPTSPFWAEFMKQNISAMVARSYRKRRLLTVMRDFYEKIFYCQDSLFFFSLSLFFRILSTNATMLSPCLASEIHTIKYHYLRFFPVDERNHAIYCTRGKKNLPQKYPQ